MNSINEFFKSGLDPHTPVSDVQNTIHNTLHQHIAKEAIDNLPKLTFLHRLLNEDPSNRILTYIIDHRCEPVTLGIYDKKRLFRRSEQLFNKMLLNILDSSTWWELHEMKKHYVMSQ